MAKSAAERMKAMRQRNREGVTKPVTTERNSVTSVTKKRYVTLEAHEELQRALDRALALMGAMEKRLRDVEDRLADVAPLLTPAPMRNPLDALRDQIAQVQGRAPVLSTPAPQPIVDNWEPA